MVCFLRVDSGPASAESARFRDHSVHDGIVAQAILSTRHYPSGQQGRSRRGQACGTTLAKCRVKKRGRMAEAKNTVQARSPAAGTLAARRRHHGLRRDAAATSALDGSTFGCDGRRRGYFSTGRSRRGPPDRLVAESLANRWGKECFHDQDGRVNSAKCPGTLAPPCAARRCQGAASRHPAAPGLLPFWALPGLANPRSHSGVFTYQSNRERKPP